VITHRYIEINELIMMCFYHLIYLMPIVNLLVVHTYNKHYQSYLRGDRSQFETMLPN
jgi:TRAP-type mannitol/chloroaromatic compound transport system permease small subunit